MSEDETLDERVARLAQATEDVRPPSELEARVLAALKAVDAATNAEREQKGGASEPKKQAG